MGATRHVTPAIVIDLRLFKSSEHITEKEDGQYRSFVYYSLVSDPLDLAMIIEPQ